MRFFEKKEEPSRAPRRRRLRREDNYGRPALWVPCYLDADLVLAVSDEAAIVMHGIACYPKGFAFFLETVTRYEVEADEDGRDEEPFGHFGRPGVPAQFGIEYSDGRRAAFDRRWATAREAQDEIVISPGAGGGGGGHWSTELWVRPLPPAGPVTFACEWEGMGIIETLQQIEGQSIRDAAEHARRVFPRRGTAT